MYHLHHAVSGGDLLIVAKGSTRLAVFARRDEQLAGKAARFALNESIDLPDLPTKARFSRCSLPGSSARDVIALSGLVGGKATRVWGMGADAAGRLQVIPSPQLETLRCSPQGVNIRQVSG